MKRKPPFANASAHAHGVVLATRRGYTAIRYGQPHTALESAGDIPIRRVQTPVTTLGDIWDKVTVKKPA